ncbi:polysaccharide biosynthesis protein [Marinilactibacillus sp. GCM10026970]|uniref:polysaccharide biosynthesis protein n=1 Tax=Marinilactibacillus sp. GCM10026970 TaxID=3252642 RepID=UPI00361C8952
MSRTSKRAITMIFDTFAIILASVFSYLFLMPYIDFDPRAFVLITITYVLMYLFIAFRFRMFDKINRYTSIKETVVHGSIVTGSFLLSTSILIFIYSDLSLRYYFLTYLISGGLISGSRILWRIFIEHKNRKRNGTKYRETEPLRTLIVGAGEGGSLFIKSLQHNDEIKLVGIVDDDLNKQKTTLFGVPVLGTIEEIDEILEFKEIDQVTIAIPSLTNDELTRIFDIASSTKVKVNQMPPVEEIVSGKYEVNKFREIDVSDLLGREEVQLDMKKIAEQITNQTILISGAGGSIGSEICRQVVRFSPKKIILLGHGENSIYLINKELSEMPNRDFEIVPVIADIQDRNRIFEVLVNHKPDRVFHAAAHKHVPMMEYNPTEAVKNNIFGTKNIAEASKEAGVENFVMISTDKAVNPPNVMGATKRIAEMIVTGLNETGSTKFVAVRFGNVLNSRGSVIPVFKEQIKNGGPITVTDFRMTRYFMTIPEASRLVLQAGSLAKGGEIFVLDMGKPVKITELARKMIKLSGHTENEIKIKESGIRPGEKLYEELLSAEEMTEKQVYDKIFIGKVTNLSLNEVLIVVENLLILKEKQLRNTLIEFANTNEFDTETFLKKLI